MSTIANRPAIASYQPSWTSHERQTVRVERGPIRPRRWGPAIVGLLLAGAAGVYGYRQLTGPAGEAEQARPDPVMAAPPELTFGPLAAPVTLAVPVNVAAPTPADVTAPKPAPAPRAALVVTSRPIARPSFEDAFRGDPARSVLTSSSEARFAEPQLPEAPVRTPPQAAEIEAIEPTLAAQAPEIAAGAALNDATDAADQPPLALAEKASVQEAPTDFAVPPDSEFAATDVAPVQPAEPEVLLPDSEIPAPIEEAIASEEVAIALPDASPEIEPSSGVAGTIRDSSDQDAPVELALRAERALARRPASTAAPPVEQSEIVQTQPVRGPTASAPANASAPSAAPYVQHFPVVVLNGTELGAITLRAFEGNRSQIHLGALLSLFRLKMQPAEYERLISSASADQFVDLEVLREAGLDARYDARRGRLVVGSAAAR